MTAGGSSTPEVQALVATLVATRPQGRVAEVGTAFGAGAMAICEALPPSTRFITVEPDPTRWAEASEALRGTRAELLHARWQEALPELAPFDLIFLDGGGGEEIIRDLELAVGLLTPGGLLIKDDLTPGIPVAGDPLRQALLHNPRLVGTEVTLTETMAAIIAVRRS